MATHVIGVDASATLEGAKQVAPRDLAACLARLRGHAIVVLGDLALRELNPGSLFGATREHCVILAPTRCPPPRLLEWSAAGFARTSELSEVARILGATIQRPCAWCRDVPFADWLPSLPPASSAGREDLAALPGLPRSHSVTAWAVRLGWSRQLLWDVCMSDFGMPPRQVLALRLRALADALRGDGLELRDIALLLGYGSAASLCNAFRRRGWRLPRRRSRRAR